MNEFRDISGPSSRAGMLVDRTNRAGIQERGVMLIGG
jgi:hypothetical protein